MRKVVLVFIIVAILTAMMFTLTGCSFTVETDENSISASVDEDTQNTFERIMDWIVERLDRIFVTEDKVSTNNSDGGRA